MNISSTDATAKQRACFIVFIGGIPHEHLQKYNYEECPSFKDCGECENCNAMPFGAKEQCICARLIADKGFRGFQDTFQHVINSINALSIHGLHVEDMNILPGSYLNLEYPLPNGETVKFLNDNRTYFANQIETDGDRRYGVVSDGSFLLVASYEPEGKHPKLLLYQTI